MSQIKYHQKEWIKVEDKLPQVGEAIIATCAADGRLNWVIETCYIPQPDDSPYSEWGNIPLLNWGIARVIAWMPRHIPKPFSEN